MEVHTDGIRGFYPAKLRAMTRREQQHRAIRRVDVEPGSSAVSQRGHLGKRINGAKVSGPRCGYDRHWNQVARPQLVERYVQRLGTHAESPVSRYTHHCFG